MDYKKHRVIIILLMLLGVFSEGLAFEKNTKKHNSSTAAETYYPSNQKEGFIGFFDDKPLDSPVDNIFTVNLEHWFSDDDEVWLTYDLYGISNHTGISRSINDKLSVGGYFVTKSEGWKQQKEQLKKGWLKQGENKIQFTLPENVTYNYRIRNLGVLIKKTGSKDRAIVINQPLDKEYVDTWGYIKGFVQGKDSDYAQIYIDDIRIRSLSSEFESVISKKSNQEKWSALIKVVFPDGEIIKKEIAYNKQTKVNFHNKIPIRSEVYALGYYSPYEELNLLVKGAHVNIQPNILLKPKTVSITNLRSVDLPTLDPGLVNVTKDYNGYRILAEDASFNGDAKISLVYDISKIPDGYTVKDIKTYYFDENTKHWVALKKRQLNSEYNTISSKFNKSGDMINGIIKVPESPQTSGYLPTSIKDIRAANPGAAINTIEPPNANNMGHANLAYSIVLPQGRHGLQPQLAVQYNNGGENSWLGLGWNIQIPSISIDTRWGVPRYNPTEESETYSMNNEQLFPVAHRTSLEPRTQEKQFYPRVEGKFDRIIRHGNSPGNYWWEVTDKSGVTYSYGGTTSLSIVESSILRDDSGNIAHWTLVEVRDLYNNFVKYHCTKVSDSGVQNGSPGQNIYIDRITYTGHGNTEGKYEVSFTRDRELGEPKRKDVIINARYAFKQVTADVLRKIDIKFSGQNVRSYEFNYTEGAFFKTLLTHIIEFDASGQEFTRQEFGYYDDVRSDDGYVPYTNQEIWAPKNDNVSGDFINPIDLFNDDASVLGGNKSFGFGFGMAVTVGPFDGNLFTKSQTAGVNFGFSHSDNQGILALIDINGDGLSDKVFKENNGLYFRPNSSGPDGETTFGEKKPILGISDFEKGDSNTFDIGLESNFVVFAGVQYSNTSNTTSTYFSDVNGDQLIDVVNNGTVFFNRINSDGEPTFSPTSTGTPSPINTSSVIDASIVTIDPQEIEDAIDQNPLHDVVKIWEAPYTGTLSINAPVALDEPEILSGTGDGVRVVIQHGDTELWSKIILAEDFSSYTPTGVSNIAVSVGDKLYFRVQSIEDGTDDLVLWNPIITYAQHTDDIKDANELPIYQYNASDDFLLTAPMAVGMPIAGTIHIEGNFSKLITSDNLTVEIVKKSGNTTSVIWQQNYNYDDTPSLDIDLEESVLKDDAILFKIKSNTTIDWNKVQWMPRVYYTASSDPDFDEVTAENGNPLLEFFPTVEHTIFNKIIKPTREWVANESDTLTITPQILPTSFVIVAEPEEILENKIVFTIKKSNELIYEQVVQVNFVSIFGIYIGTLDTFSSTDLIVNQNDKLFFDYHIRNRKIANQITNANVEISGNFLSTITPGMYTTIDSELSFGMMYRHWGQFAYNGNRDRANQPINETELKLETTSDNTNEIDLSEADDADAMNQIFEDEGGNNACENKFIYMIPVMQNQAYIGYDNLTFVKKNNISSSRMGADNIQPVTPLTGATGGGSGTGAIAIKRVSKTENVNFSGGLGVSASYSTGWTKQLYDYIDMNGDRHPDIVSDNKIQYTLPTGGLEPEARDLSFGEVHRSTHQSVGLSLGGTFPKSGPQNSNKSGRGSKSSKSESGARIAAGLSANFNTNLDEVKFAWMDINGDGLPDRVYANGEVELNYGYEFGIKEQWGYLGLSDGKSISYGGGLSINISNYSISAGVGLSRTENVIRNTLRDVNGDGLLDYILDQGVDSNLVSPILDNNTTSLMVAINTGNGFANPILWNNIKAVNKGVSTGESANGAFTACIPIIPIVPVVKLCFNPSANISQGVSKNTMDLTDIDGDGFPDFLESDQDNQLFVRRSTIARTNLLKEVKQPLGSKFALDYKRLGNTYNLPNDIWALSRVETFDGFIGDGADTGVSTFDYSNGRYDRNEREFYGFESVKTHHLDTENNDAIYRTHVQEYNINNYYEKGLLKREAIQDANENIYTESINTFEIKDILTGATLPDTYIQEDGGAAFPANIEMEKQFYEGQDTAQKNTRMTYSYDVLGNLTTYTDFGDIGNDDDYTTTINYHSVSAPYIMNVPSSMSVLGNGQTFRVRETDIDINTGSIIRIRNQLDGGDDAIYDLEYNAFGNLTKITNPENTNGERFFYTYEYDPEVQTYTTGINDAYGYSTSSDYDYRFGKILLNTDFNDQQIRYEIDNVGRTKTITGPFELAAGLPYTIAFEYYPNAEIPWAKTKHYDPQNPDNNLETISFIDGLKRSIQIKKDAAIYNAPGVADDEKMIVSGQINYDAFGRKTESYHPITEPKGNESTFNPIYDAIAPTSKEYDVLDRATKITFPDNAETNFVYGFGNDREGNIQLLTRITDPNGIWKENFENVRGLTKSVKEQYSQGSDIWTSYNYNAINELIEVKDAQENVINMSYDWFGRRTEVVHPDAGSTRFEFDLASNLTKKKTANLQLTGNAINYVYDFERLVEISYPENPQNNVVYTYGEPGANYNRVGRIVLQEDATGAQEFFYDSLGALTKAIRTIVVPDSELLTYTTEWTYDTWNRVTNMLYPDGEEVVYMYNLGGKLNSFNGLKDGADYNYLTQLSYDKFEDEVYRSYGNNTETFYSYEPDRRRLKTTVSETAEDRKFMDYVYTYDNVDNILRLQNNAEIPSSNLMGGQTDYNYSYDDLYRLTNATGSHLGSNHENRYTLDMEYNSIHNIVNKNQLHQFKGYDDDEWSPRNKTTYDYAYQYGDTQPHAPIHVEDQTFTYDANGNQTGWTHDVSGQERQMLWDEENRIKAIADNGAIYSYTYDAHNERVLKSNGGGQTVAVNGSNKAGNGSIGNYTIYVNPFVVIRNSMVTKHFFVEDQRIVTKLNESNEGLLQKRAGSSGIKAISYSKKQGQLKNSINKIYSDLGIDIDDFITEDNSQNRGNGNGNGNGTNNGSGGNGNNKEAFVYYYHHDQIESSSYITDSNGEVTQHLEYFAFGETFLEEHSNTERTPYLYNSKELDEETNLYYYGARYYDGKTSVWQSVDPPILGAFLDGKHYGGVYNSSNLGVYNYVGQNPIKYLDPDGNGKKIKYLSTVKKVNGRWPINAKYAGKWYHFRPAKKHNFLRKKYPKGVYFNVKGFPDFMSFAIKTVVLKKLQSTSGKDFTLANKKAKYKKTPKGFTWHHVENSTKLILIPTDVHDGVKHTGGRATKK
nr:SpvB/TcaC N-terminal domain-containing protein [uncultured Psychroserpens sp.]